LGVALFVLQRPLICSCKEGSQSVSHVRQAAENDKEAVGYS
jgi:hypothetical protein